MRAALIGLPFSGKTSVFEILTGVENGKKEENMGTIKVPDERVDVLSEIYSPKKKTYAEFILSDFYVPISRDVIISPKVKNLIQKTELLVIVLRNFDSLMTSDEKNPYDEYKKIIEDIMISDFMVIEKKIEREKKERKNLVELPVLQKLKDAFEKGECVDSSFLSDEDLEKVSNYNFLSLKKRIVLVNQSEGETVVPEDLAAVLKKENVAVFSICASVEKELAELSPEEQLEFLEGFGLTETANVRFIKETYSALGLISFLTAGPDEVRAWPIKDGTVAVVAAGKIHSDIARGFIRAETIDFETFMKYGSESECKKAGVFRLEGKEYTMRDGDIVNFRFNV